MSEIMCKIAKLNEPVKEFFMSNGSATVATALELSGYDSEGYQVKVNGRIAEASTPLFDGALVTLVPKLKAG